jgi:hypothetical protein
VQSFLPKNIIADPAKSGTFPYAGEFDKYTPRRRAVGVPDMAFGQTDRRGASVLALTDDSHFAANQSLCGDEGKKLTRDRVVPIISANVSWLIFASIGFFCLEEVR